jgi:hypothetical protein
VPYVATKVTPHLYEPGTGYSRNASFQKNIIQVLTGAENSNKKELESAWGSLISSLNKDGNAAEWTGSGINEGAGPWVGVIGWDDIEVCDSYLVHKVQAKETFRHWRAREVNIQRHGES